MYTRLTSSVKLCVLVLIVGTFVLALTAAVRAEDPADVSRVNLATWYKVDPSWPRRPPEAKWASMAGIAVDEKDQIWLFTRADPPVQVYRADGKYVRGWGEGLIGAAHHIKIDHQGNVWLADIGRHVVRQFTPEGKLLKTLGTLDESGNDRDHLNKPTDMAVTPSGDVFVSDGYGNRRVVHFDKHGKFVKAWGKEGIGPGEFLLPHAIDVDSKGLLYVADRSNARVQVFDQSGKFIAQWRNLIVPWGITITAKDEVWVCGSSPMAWEEGPSQDAAGLGCPPKDQVFMKFDTTGRLLQLWTAPNGKDSEEQPGEMNWLHIMAVDSKGNIYAGDIKGQSAQKFVRQN